MGTGFQDGLDGQRSGIFGTENVGDHVVDKVLHPLDHPVADLFGLPQKLVFKGQVEFLVVSRFQAFGPGIVDHLGPQRFGRAGIFDLDEVTVGVQNGVAVVVDFQAPGDHLQGSGHIGLGGAGSGRDFPQPVGIVARGAVLGP